MAEFPIRWLVFLYDHDEPLVIEADRYEVLRDNTIKIKVVRFLQNTEKQNTETVAVFPLCSLEGWVKEKNRK